VADKTVPELGALATLDPTDLLVVWSIVDNVLRKMEASVLIDLILAAAAGTYLEVANNLSDVANVPTARGNLGLGGSATKDVGTTAGTVAAGDDSRFTTLAAAAAAAAATANAALPKAGGTLSGLLTLLGGGEALRWGARGGLASNGVGIEILWFDRANQTGIQFDWTISKMSFLFGGVAKASLDMPTATFTSAGPIVPNGTP
jgi:hypothetical protein